MPEAEARHSSPRSASAIGYGLLFAIAGVVLAFRPAHAHDPGESGDPDRAPSGFEFLPARTLFEPLSGDPRWPRFSASFIEFKDDPELDSVGSVSMGGSIPIFQAPLFFGGRWEVGVQAGIFSIFDLDSDSYDLVNTDFWVGLPISARWSALSLTIRPHHQSSHLGDEYLLRGETDRIDINFEGVDGILSVDLWSWGRIYGGGGYLLDRDPESLERKYVQVGLELNGPLWFGVVRPIAAGDFQRREASDWRTDYSARVGIQFESAKLGRRRIQLLGEYYEGRNPNGQFFDRRIEYVGVGIHAHF